MAGRSRLVLRSPKFVALAYIVSPAVALTGYWLTIVIPIWNNPSAVRDMFGPTLALILMFGGFACLLMEIIFVTPILMGFRLYRWPWLNTWTAAAIGFALGFIPWMSLSLLSDPPRSAYWLDGVGLIVNGERAMVGWLKALRESGMLGAIGLVSALVFRLIAVTTEETPAN